MNTEAQTENPPQRPSEATEVEATGMDAEAQAGDSPRQGGNGLGQRLAALGVVLAALAVIVLLVWLLPQRVTDKPAAAAPPVAVTVRPIEPIAKMEDTFDLYGVVEPWRVVEVAAEVPGRVERYGVRSRNDGGGPIREGDTVSKGQVLVVLNTDLPQAEYDLAKARKEFDEGEYQRILAADKQGVATQTQLQSALTAMNMSRAQFQAARVQLDRATITSPIAGVLDALPAEVGEYANVSIGLGGGGVARIVDVSKVKVVLDVPENDVSYLKIGQVRPIRMTGGSDKTLTGKISFISELADEDTRTSRVEITVDNRDRVLRAGRIVRVSLLRRELTNVIMVQLQQVISTKTRKYVYVEVDGKAQRREVKLGFYKGWSVQVLEGLSAGDRLIVEGHRYVAPGQPVRVVSVRSNGPLQTALGDEAGEDAP